MHTNGNSNQALIKILGITASSLENNPRWKGNISPISSDTFIKENKYLALIQRKGELIPGTDLLKLPMWKPFMLHTTKVSQREIGSRPVND